MPDRGPFVWQWFYLPSPIKPDAARAAVVALAALTGQPRIVLEAVGEHETISWRVGSDASVSRRIVDALRPHLPKLRVDTDALSSRLPTEAATLHLSGSRRLPLRSDALEPVTLSVLGALALAHGQEQVRLQLVLGPRYRPRRVVDVEPGDRRAVQAKFTDFRFGCLVRIAATSADPARAHRLVDRVADGLRALETHGVRLRLRRSAPAAVTDVRSPWRWPLELGIDELLPVLGWPIARTDQPLPGVPSIHPQLLPPARQPARDARLLGVATTNSNRPLGLTVDDSLRGLHILGPTGVGKSELLCRLALQDIEQGRGVAVIDPKSDAVTALLARIPKHRLQDVVVIDPTDSAPVGINGLVGGNADLAADTLLHVIHSLYADAWGPRTHDILHAALLTLARRGDASLVMVPLLLTNPGFRRSVVGQAVKADPLGLGTFWAWYEGISDAERSQAIAPLLNKLRPILLRPGIRAIFGQRSPKFDIRDVFTKRRILLVPLSQGTIGPEAAKLLGSVVVALLWQAAQERTALPATDRAPVMIHIDEVAEYLRLPGDLGAALAQARGLGVSFTLSHQFLAQLPAHLREGVLANTRSKVWFQLSPHDARDLARTTGGQLETEDLQQLPVYQAYASLLVRGTTAPWVSLTTEALPPSTRSPEVARASSRAAYGVPLDSVEADLLRLTETGRADGLDRLGRTPRRPIAPDSEDAS